jgi:CO/xanthine dehydrogenase FAD-binding subunit
VDAAPILARLRSLPPDTIVTHVLWLATNAATPPRGGFWEIASRDGHKALVGAAVALHGDAACRVTLCGLGDTAFPTTTVGATIAAALPKASAVEAIAAALASDLNADPAFVVKGDGVADAAYRRDVAPVVIQRAVQRALAEAAHG